MFHVTLSDPELIGLVLSNLTMLHYYYYYYYYYYRSGSNGELV